MGCLYEDDVIPRHRAEEPDISLAIREAAGMLLERHVHVTGGQLPDERLREGDGRGAADNLHPTHPAAPKGYTIYESSVKSRSITPESDTWAAFRGCHLSWWAPLWLGPGSSHV